MNALGQSFGELRGTVTDPSGAVIAGAKVTVTNTGTAVERDVETNASGSYSVPFLNPGVYEIKAELEGFKTGRVSGRILEVGDVQEVTLTLELGVVTEVVEVEAGMQMLQTADTSVNNVIDQQRIVDLPINGRNYLNLVKLSPNVTAEMGNSGFADSRQGGERANQPISVAGQRQQFNRFSLDGVENTDVNLNTFVIRPSIDAIQEFKVQSGVYSAQHGRATAHVNVSTRSGTNQFHGAVYEFHRNDALDAAEWNVEGEKNPFVRNQFGAVFHGPILRNRLFFLANYEGLRDRKTFQGRANVATTRMRQGDFAGVRPVYDPATRVYGADAAGNEVALSADRFSNDVIPASRFSEVSKRLLEFHPEPTRSGDNAFQNYLRDVSRPNDWDQVLTRIDWNAGAYSSWFGRYAVGDEAARDDSVIPFTQQRTEVQAHQAMLSNIWTVSPTMVNEARFGYNRFNNDVIPFFANERNVTAELGINGMPDVFAPAWGPPTVRFRSGLDLQNISPGANPWVNRNRSFQFLDNLSWVKGAHTIKLGGELRRDHFNHLGGNGLTGWFDHSGFATFDPSTDARRGVTGVGFADFLLGEAEEFRLTLLPGNVRFRSMSFSLYAEDSWRARPDLTITFGLRYELTPSWNPTGRGILNMQMFDPGVGPNGILEGSRLPVITRPGEGAFYEGLDFRYADGIPVQAGDQYMGSRLVRTDYNDVAPRLGVAHKIGDRWTVRYGAGLFFAQDTGNPRADMGRNLSGSASAPGSVERPIVPTNDPFRFVQGSAQCSNWDGPCSVRPVIFSNTENRKTPYIAQWMFNIQHQLTDRTALEAGYLGSSGSRLERWRWYNEPVQPIGPDDRRSPQSRRPWPIYSGFHHLSNGVNSNHNAASLKVRQRLDRGLNYLIGYTWSKSIDSGSGIRTGRGDSLFPDNDYDLNSERGLSQFHTAHRLVTSVLYELPMGPGKALFTDGLASRILGGWQVGSIVTFATGTPANVGGGSGGGRIGFRPHATGISPKVENPTPDRFWNADAFDWSNPNRRYIYGNAGRNVLLLPGFAQWDFSLLKETTLHENHRLQFRFEAFNFSNHPNWHVSSGASGNIRSPAFGRIFDARTMRELQIGLKYLF